MKTTARFDVLRERTLSEVFTLKNLKAVWASVVRQQLRSFDVQDLHDYFDFSLNIESRAREIRNLILNGQYAASPPLVYRLEKKFGICRHLMIPSPGDALVFQIITEHIANELAAVTPSEKAFYSRDKHQLKLPHQLSTASAYPWFVLWPLFQKEILKFSRNKDYLVVTDVTNFFDSIGLRELRHIVSARVKVDEVILDLLFKIIEQLTWVPDYLPSSLRGLPTINLEAFRLLAHVMLFEIDEILLARARGNFVRWMDDINFGVDSRDDAHLLLGEINDVLKSRGMALNLSKTRIYTSSEAKEHFLFDQNQRLNKFEKLRRRSKKFPSERRRFLRDFRDHLQQKHLRNWDKVTKRFFTIAGKHKLSSLHKECGKLFTDHPDVRPAILRYMLSLGYSPTLAELTLDLLSKTRRHDDVSLLALVRFVVQLEVPRTPGGRDFIEEVSAFLAEPETNFDFLSSLTFSAKYQPPSEILNLIHNESARWKDQQFMARQVVSVLPRILPSNKNGVKMLEEQVTSGPRDAASVAISVLSLHSTSRLRKRVISYLNPPEIHRPYPLQKFLMLNALLSSPTLSPSEKAKLDVLRNVTDPWYRYWLEPEGLLE
jgi:hypothetical protein